MPPGSSAWRSKRLKPVPTRRNHKRAALAKAIAWLDAASPADLHQDKALKVLLGARAGKSREALQTTIDELLALQRTDGGWSQDRPRTEKRRRLCHRSDALRFIASRVYGRAPGNPAGVQLSRRHPNAGRQLANDFAFDPRRLHRKFKTPHADRLHLRLLGRAGLGQARAEEEVKNARQGQIKLEARNL